MPTKTQLRSINPLYKAITEFLKNNLNVNEKFLEQWQAEEKGEASKPNPTRV